MGHTKIRPQLRKWVWDCIPWMGFVQPGHGCLFALLAKKTKNGLFCCVKPQSYHMNRPLHHLKSIEIPFHTFKNFHVGWHSSTLEPPAFWGVWHPWHLPNLASESCAIWVSCSRYVPTCSSAWEGITRNPPVNEHISPLKGTFESMMFLFPFGWDMLVPGRGTPCYTPMSMWTFHHQISLFKNGPLFESEQWIDLAPELVPVGIAHPSAVGTTNASNPNQQKSPNGWLRKNTTTSTVSKASRISKDFPRIEFFKHQVPCGGHNQMISPRYCDSRISRKWPEWCSFKRKAPVIAVLVFYVMILRTKHRKKHTFWHFEAY